MNELKELLKQRRELEQEAQELTQASWHGVAVEMQTGLNLSKRITKLQQQIDKLIDEL